jgi:hypothetical protein
MVRIPRRLWTCSRWVRPIQDADAALGSLHDELEARNGALAGDSTLVGDDRRSGVRELAFEWIPALPPSWSRSRNASLRGDARWRRQRGDQLRGLAQSTEPREGHHGRQRAAAVDQAVAEGARLRR